MLFYSRAAPFLQNTGVVLAKSTSTLVPGLLELPDPVCWLPSRESQPGEQKTRRLPTGMRGIRWLGPRCEIIYLEIMRAVWAAQQEIHLLTAGGKACSPTVVLELRWREPPDTVRFQNNVAALVLGVCSGISAPKLHRSSVPHAGPPGPAWPRPRTPGRRGPPRPAADILWLPGCMWRRLPRDWATILPKNFIKRDLGGATATASGFLPAFCAGRRSEQQSLAEQAGSRGDAMKPGGCQAAGWSCGGASSDFAHAAFH